jgi:Carbohydrate-binding domain-containing protein Cthe_2159
MKRVHMLPAAAFAIIFSLASCSDDDSSSTNTTPGQATAEANVDADSDYNFSNARQIQFSGNSATTDDSTVMTEEGRVTITQAGTYHVSGNFSNGQLVVDADAEDQVKIILDGANITSNSGAAIDVENADKVVIRVEGGSTNTISDASGNSAQAAIDSNTKLTIFGDGTLTVNGNSGAAIHSDGGIIFRDATFNFNANADAVASGFNITVFDGNFTVNADEDGFNAGTDIRVEGGNIDIVQSEEGFEASAMVVSGGEIHVSATEDGIDVDGESTSLATQLQIEDGYVYINAQGNGFNAEGNISVEDGTVVLEGAQGDHVAVSTSGNFAINGGFFVGVNASGQGETPNAASLQNSVVVNFESQQDANTIVHLQTLLGAQIATFRPSGSFRSVIVSSASINDNANLQLYTGGTVTGDITDSIYDFISYIGGMLQATFDVTGSVTVVNTDEA